jgi:hypothetical protein
LKSDLPVEVRNRLRLHFDSYNRREELRQEREADQQRLTDEEAFRRAREIARKANHLVVQQDMDKAFQGLWLRR